MSRLLSGFLRYVRMNTQSAASAKTIPSTPGQWSLLQLLQKELRQIGARDIYLSPQGHLMGTVPSSRAGLPTVALIAHVDTAPDFSAAGVKPLVHRAWNGKPIRLPDDPSRVLSVRRDPELRSAIGQDLITASGRTLLGADDKAGVAIIMALGEHLLSHPEVEHGPIRLCFLPDEEVGLRGATSLNLDRLGANAAYTLDGGGVGQVVGESFSGDAAAVTIEGVATHPGQARKHGLVNAVHLAGKLLAALPREFTSPETTDDYQGYIHPVEITGNAARVSLHFILRDFNDPGLADKRRRLAGLCRGLQATEPRAHIDCKFTPSYRNMAAALRADPRPFELAMEAVRRLGLTPECPPIRGGTDGSMLSGRGLATPNLSNGSHNVHGPLEWVTLQDMATAWCVCLELIRLWADKGRGYRGYRSKGRK